MVGGLLVGIVLFVLFDIWFGYEEMQVIDCVVGYGGMIVFLDDIFIVSIVVQVLCFGSCELCGKCIFCYLGMFILVVMVQVVVNGMLIDGSCF